MNVLKMLMEALEGQKIKRAEFIKKTYGVKISNMGLNVQDFVEKIGEADPTKNGAYMQWIAKLITKAPDENRIEDLDRLRTDLELFEKNKTAIENKDVNSYKTFHDLFMVISPFTAPKKKTASERKLEKIKASVDVVYNGPEGWIRVPKTAQAAAFLGQSTRWCTTNKSMFDHYSSTDFLFVVYDKKLGKRFQLHIRSGQYADDTDKNQGISALPDWALSHIKNWYKGRTDLSLSHLLAFKDEELVKGTEHEDLFNLMKQYGV